ncbi:MAG: matrixin family metalloprotease [Acidobacteria bacterium]|nr:matrixin family metalloprotease [Acidobacteriota bacterium]
MRRPSALLLLVAVIFWSAASVRPYSLQFTDASGRAQIKWPTHTINIAFSSSLSASQANVKAGSDVVGALRRALASWSEAADVEFVETSSKEQSISASGTSGDGISLITIAATQENVAPFVGAASEMSGRTRVFFTKSGSITEADIVLNPYQQFSTDGTPGTYDLEATFMHEIGHLLGLEHSSVVGATMQPRQGKNGIYSLPAFTGRTLSPDDLAGVRAIYGMRPELATARGSVTGTISYRNGSPVFGANVWAEEAQTGRLAGSSVTLSNGAYQIENLLPGRYYLKVEPLDGPVFAAEIASQRGAYAGLASSQLVPFRTEEIGQVNIAADRSSRLNAQLSDKQAQLNPTFIGYNGQLSTLAVPLAPGRTYTIYLGGDGLNLKQLAEGGVTTTSPYLSVNQATIAQQQFGANLSVISFDVTVNENAPAGDYSLRVQALNGEVAYLSGGLTVDASVGSLTP